ncbi:hypothetical protein SAMN02983003_4025 [Devosia enhydra]|uniref:Uncharacterized protein n=1 Tax=Devosia enhydra TaxID=665118 RepID=A0A1K2I3M4_9HYPH|nr:hypothetical protein [Devosia enhydra]SFZ86831.1 hypothetical protein SAMN02983003_4025 [Devosia enhydra]
MTPEASESRIARIEAMQSDMVQRLGRLEAQERAAPRPGPTPRGINWAMVGLGVLGLIVLFWVVDELPGPPFWHRLF